MRFRHASDTDGDVQIFTVCSFVFCYTTGAAAGLFYKKKFLLLGLYVAVENIEHLLSLLEANECKQSTNCMVA